MTKKKTNKSQQLQSRRMVSKGQPEAESAADLWPRTAEATVAYTLADCAQETGFSEEELARWVKAIERKKHAILYGPPGTGKTFLAKRLARHLKGTDGFQDLVQFHPAYTYEDFIEGIRPQENEEGALELKMVPGRFRSFCAYAARHSGRCILVIDEINRTNLSRVFGELMYLMEYRDEWIHLAGASVFTIPENVRILGTMNTADRSIALVDHALRRRFAFIELTPRYDILEHYHAQHNPGLSVTGLSQLLQQLNSYIEKDYCVGITFFLRPALASEIADIWEMEIVPYLEEYFYDQPEKVARFRWPQVQGEIGLT